MIDIKIIILAILLILIPLIIKEFTKNKRNKKIKLNYKKCNSLFTKSEINFLQILKIAIDNNKYEIYGKVRIADILKPNNINKKTNYIAFNKIKSKHFDYVICNKNNYLIEYVIELNDKSHNLPKRRERDNFVRNACKSANLKLIEIPAKRIYDIKEIREKINK